MHFQGWNAKWDKWIPDRDLVVDTPDVKELAKVRMQEARARKKNKGKSKVVKAKQGKNDIPLWLQEKQEEIEQKRRAVTEKEAAAVVKSLKRKRNKNDIELEFTAGATHEDDAAIAATKRKVYLEENNLDEVRTEVQKLSLPFSLKKSMNTEHQRVTLNNIAPDGYPLRMVADLPSPRPIVEVLNEYRESKYSSLNADDEESKAAREGWSAMVDGLLSFFDTVCPVLCLYQQEIPQCEALKSSDKLSNLNYSSIYGAEYLLRLLVRLPVLLVDYLSQPLLDGEQKNISRKVNDLLRFLEKNQTNMFRQSYRRPKLNELLPHEAKNIPK